MSARRSGGSGRSSNRISSKSRRNTRRKFKLVVLGVPKGSLQATTLRLFELAGYNLSVGARSYYPAIDDPEIECMLIRAQEMARYVEQGVLDAGITGLDWIQETGAKVKELADLRAPWPNYRPVRWLLSVKEGSKLRRVEDLEGCRIATEAVGLTRKYLKQHKVRADVEFSWGATEVKPPVLADAIVDVSETGSSIRANNLKVLDTVLETSPRLIANPAAYRDAWKRRKLDRLLLMLQGAIAAAGRVGLMMNVRRSDLDAVLTLLPALASPTISALADDEWVALNTIVEEATVRELLPELVEKGATGLVEFPISKIMG